MDKNGKWRCQGIIYDFYKNKKRQSQKRKHDDEDQNEDEQELTIEQAASSYNSQSFELEQELKDDKQWLKYHNDPFEIVKKKWESTIDMRRNEISQTIGTSDQTYLSIIFSEWPLYKQSFGHILVIAFFMNTFF